MNEDKNKNNKNMTIDDLARMMQSEFRQMGNELAEVKTDVKWMKDDELPELKSDVKWMKDTSCELFNKLDKLIKLYEDQRTELTSLTAQVNRLQEEVDYLKSKI